MKVLGARPNWPRLLVHAGSGKRGPVSGGYPGPVTVAEVEWDTFVPC